MGGEKPFAVMKKILLIVMLCSLLSGCQTTRHRTTGSAPTPVSVPLVQTAVANIPGAIVPNTKIPKFEHIIVIVFENRNYADVIGNSSLPTFNQLATDHVLLTQYYAVTHPSLPNYLALIGGDTFGITSDCNDCFINQKSLPDLIEASGRSWKTYQEDLPAPCFIGDSGYYAQKHDPFIYFDSIRTQSQRCQKSVVPLTALDADLARNTLPDYSFIMPNLCNSGHDCNLQTGDKWLGRMINKLTGSTALGQQYLIAIVFDEASEDNSSCCGLPGQAGGRVMAVLVSPLAKAGFQDKTPLSHYSLLKTILVSWGLPGLGFTTNQATQAITAPWK